MDLIADYDARTPQEKDGRRNWNQGSEEYNPEHIWLPRTLLINKVAARNNIMIPQKTRQSHRSASKFVCKQEFTMVEITAA